jgi:hypothetical protein
MPLRRSFRWLSIAAAAALSLLGATAAYAATDFGLPPAVPLAVGSPSPDPSTLPTDFPSPTPSITESPTPTGSPTPTPTITPSPTPNPCEPPPPESDPTDPHGAQAVQDEIATVAGQISALVDQNGYTGFAGMIADQNSARLLLCWLGGEALPGPIADIVANPGQPITVVRQDAAYSYDDLSSRVDSILDNTSVGAQIAGRIHTVTVPEEGTGLIASVLPNDPNVDPNQFIAQAQPVLSNAAGVPVTVQIDDVVEPATRLADTSPWYGGARLTDNAGTKSCSSGFGLIRRTDNAQLLLTAYHCYGVQAVFNGPPPGNPARQQIGTVTSGVQGGDSEAIAIAAPGTAGGFIYNGGVNDATEGIARVTGVAVNIPNLFVCTSGSFSGEHCLLRISRTNVFFNIAAHGIVYRVGPVDRAVGRLGPPAPVAISLGDSGGPVVLYRADGNGVNGMGTIIGGSARLQFPCAVYDGRTCFPDVYFNKLTFLLNDYNARLP